MFNLEMNSDRELYLCDCHGILGYSDGDIALDFGKFSMRIFGCDLSMVSYANGEMYIEGQILRIEFEPQSTAAQSSDRSADSDKGECQVKAAGSDKGTRKSKAASSDKKVA